MSKNLSQLLFLFSDHYVPPLCQNNEGQYVVHTAIYGYILQH